MVGDDSTCQFGHSLVGVGLQQLGSTLRPSKEFNRRCFVRKSQQMTILVFIVRLLTSQVLIDSLVNFVTLFLLLLFGDFASAYFSALRLFFLFLYNLDPFSYVFFTLLVFVLIMRLLANLGLDKIMSDFSHFTSSVNYFLPVHQLLEDSLNLTLHGEVFLSNFVGYGRCKLLGKDSLHYSLTLYITRVVNEMRLRNGHCLAVVIDSGQPTSLRQRSFVHKDTVSVV